MRENIIALDTEEKAETFLGFVEERLDRLQIPDSILQALIVNIPEISARKPLEFLNGFRRTIHSVGSQKNKGLLFRMEVPLSWTIMEGKRPNVLWLLTSSNMEISLVVTVQVMFEVSSQEEREIARTELDQLAEVILNKQYLEDSLGNYVNSSTEYIRTSLYGQPCAILQFQAEQQSLSMSVQSKNRMYVIVFENYRLELLFILPNQHKHHYPGLEVFADAIVNTLIIENKFL